MRADLLDAPAFGDLRPDNLQLSLTAQASMSMRSTVAILPFYNVMR
jgi:hypothetical protein